MLEFNQDFVGKDSRSLPQKRRFEDRDDPQKASRAGSALRLSTQEESEFEEGHQQFKRQRLNDDTDLSLRQQTELRKSLENAKNLPIAKHRNQILKKLERGRVLIVSGDTGCGKTTQVPKYLLEHGAATNQEVNIICTQPRRLAAINIAKRVALELQDRVGNKIGYQVAMESRTSPETRVLFMTTGIFLMRLVNSPESFHRYTHIIMDEVHERDLDIDFSLVVLKHLLARMQTDSTLNFKLILMSATFNTTLFANYFSKSSVAKVESMEVYVGVEEKYRKEEAERQDKLKREWGAKIARPLLTVSKASSKASTSQVEVEDGKDDDDEWVEEKPDPGRCMPVQATDDPAEVIEINARLFKVTEFYIDQIIKNIRSQREQLGLTAQDKDLIHEAFESFHSNKPSIKEGVMRVASIIICDIIERQNTFNDDPEEEKKGILVFLPGLHEIFEFMEFLRDFYPAQWLANHLELIPLHSTLSPEEQDKAFRSAAFMRGRRKVIIATNIAESSITIPDIKYVLDFMLTKELYYDPVSKSETLQLHYSSKASSKQRAGRAGRVADGFVFRMCSQSFFENGIPQYPKPEMQRCPLEKLILQVKLWGAFGPHEILGRAIQPPEFRDICNATKNLQATGALTMVGPLTTEEEHTPIITALGRIFVNLPCDLKITRLFLFGMTLKCMHQAIIMGCIHSQTRSIFRGNRAIDQINMTKLQCAYDERRDSDSIMLLRVYEEWQRRWHPELSHKEDENAKPREEREQQRRRWGGKRLRFRITQQERKWCSDKSLDVNILRETALMVDEVKNRFLRMNIPLQCLNSRVRVGEEYPGGELILKTCIGGAFYSKYIKPQYKNEDLLAKMRSTALFETSDHQRALILNKIPNYITEAHLKQFFETKFKVPVEKVLLSVDKPVIVFGKEILDTGYIKACFKLGTRNRQSRYKRIEDEEFERKQKFRSAIMSDGRKMAEGVYFSYEEIKEKLECEELRRPNFLYELRFETLAGDNYVDFDMDSINNFTHELDPLEMEQVTFACLDYHDKGGRFLCRSGTRLPSVPMVDALFCLVFAPVVQVLADDEKKFFSKVICDGGELVVNLTHVLTHHDLETIQKIRNMLNETLCNEDNIKQAHLAQVDFLMKKLLSFQRLSLDIFTKLQALRDEDESKDHARFLEKQKKLESEASGFAEENFFLEDQVGDAKNRRGYEEIQMESDGQIKEDLTQIEALERQNKEAERGYFLQPIYAQKLERKIFLYDDLVHELKDEFRDRLDKKRSIIERVQHRCKELALRDASLLCERCGKEVAQLKTMTYEADDKHRAKCVFGHLKRVEIDAALKDPEGLYSQPDNQDFIGMYLEIFEEMKQRDQLGIDEQEQALEAGAFVSTMFKPKKAATKDSLPKYAFASCRADHLVGIVIDQKYYFTDVSQLKMMFPQGHYEDWSAQFWSPGYAEAFELQSKLNIKRARDTNRYGRRQPKLEGDHETVHCELCNVECADADEFILHCSKDQTHLELVAQFNDESYDQIFAHLDKKQAEQQAKKDELIAARDLQQH